MPIRDRENLYNLYKQIATAFSDPNQEAVLRTLVDAFSEVDTDYEVVDDDPLEQYRPWLREGQPWRSEQGNIGMVRNVAGQWQFAIGVTHRSLVHAGGHPIGTVWDVLPTAVCTARVRGGIVIAYNLIGSWHTTYPGFRTAYPDGDHDRPEWAANLPEDKQ